MGPRSTLERPGARKEDIILQVNVTMEVALGPRELRLPNPTTMVAPSAASSGAWWGKLANPAADEHRDPRDRLAEEKRLASDVDRLAGHAGVVIAPE
jgi:hypothetical protein